MHKLQVFVDYAHLKPKPGLVRNPLYLFKIFENPHGVKLLTKPLSSTEAYAQLGLWQKRLQGRLGILWRFAPTLPIPPNYVNSEDHDRLSETLQAIIGLLQGRILSERQILKTMRQDGFWPSLVSAALDLGVYRATLHQYPGFEVKPWGSLLCSRCQSGEVSLRPCLNCGSQECWYCFGCESMGGNRGCSTYFTTNSNVFTHPPSEVQLKLDFSFTQAQSEAGHELVHFWDSQETRALVWAACGAGKTEVTFPLIQKALEEGQEVLFAIPRTDIVREMATRLEDAFPQVSIASHFAGQPLIAPAQLVVATTHQVLHFYQRFQLVILDEVDAFPYDGSELLRFGLLRSLRPMGKMVEMTATPKNLKSYERVITIPARYHGYPLPEPKLIIKKLPTFEELEKLDLPELIFAILEDPTKSWLVFAPTILACTNLFRILERLYPELVGICHSKEQQRTETIQSFRLGELRILVTTSVLERGVNFPGVNVVVLYAEHGVFSPSALVQMAGRVGRSVQFPRGEVMFIAARKTKNISTALDLIHKLNVEAEARGLLQHETLS